MKVTGKIHIHHDIITSTNDYALDLISKTTPIDGTAISADLQTMGRGQFDRIWQGNKSQNVALSVIYLPVFLNIMQQFLLNKAIALSVHALIKFYLSNEVVKIKWPNDIYVGDHKIAGILIQNILQGSKIKNTVAGIGINVFQKDWPHLETKPTSIINHLPNVPLIQEIIHKLFRFLDSYILLIHQGDFEVIDSLYNTNLYKRNEVVQYLYKNCNESGRIKSVDLNGRLEIETKSGNQLFDHGTITFLN
jgi:BirA family biotin operon repressor/biotin-[acetyl-CoA-carboxylase] ligase